MEGIKHGAVNGVVSDLGSNLNSRIYKLVSCPAMPPVVSFPSIYLFHSVWMKVKKIRE